MLYKNIKNIPIKQIIKKILFALLLFICFVIVVLLIGLYCFISREPNLNDLAKQLSGYSTE